MKRSNLISAALLGTFTLAPIALAEDTVTGKAKNAVEAVKRTVYDIADKDSATIGFNKGSTTLTDNDVRELRATMDAVKDDAGIKEILVISYADKPYPRDQKDSLASADQTLAKKRGDATKSKLEGLGAKNITIYNMAEKANWFEKTFVTNDAQIKNEAHDKVGSVTADDSFYESLGRLLTRDGGAGKVVVVMRRDASVYASH